MSAVIVVDRSHSQPDARIAALARWLIAALFVVSGVTKALTFSAVSDWMSAEGVAAADAALTATIALEVVGGLLLGAGIRVRALAFTLVAFVIAATLQFHAFWSVPPEFLQDQLTQFLKNAAIIGALLMLAVTSPRSAPR